MVPLVAHAALVAKGILHRDISAGNILILKEDMKKEKRLPPQGLLADMELAKILPNHDSELSSLLPGIDEDITRPEFTVGHNAPLFYFSSTLILVHATFCLQ
jgi:Fungal protein kinase